MAAELFDLLGDDPWTVYRFLIGAQILTLELAPSAYVRQAGLRRDGFRLRLSFLLRQGCGGQVPPTRRLWRTGWAETGALNKFKHLFGASGPCLDLAAPDRFRMMYTLAKYGTYLLSSK